MTVDLRLKIQLNILVRDYEFDSLVLTITESARTGKIGDGKIFIITVAKSLWIRTVEIES